MKAALLDLLVSRADSHTGLLSFLPGQNWDDIPMKEIIMRYKSIERIEHRVRRIQSIMPSPIPLEDIVDYRDIFLTRDERLVKWFIENHMPTDAVIEERIFWHILLVPGIMPLLLRKRINGPVKYDWLFAMMGEERYLDVLEGLFGPMGHRLDQATVDLAIRLGAHEDHIRYFLFTRGVLCSKQVIPYLIMRSMAEELRFLEEKGVTYAIGSKHDEILVQHNIALYYDAIEGLPVWIPPNVVKELARLGDMDETAWKIVKGQFPNLSYEDRMDILQCWVQCREYDCVEWYLHNREALPEKIHPRVVYQFMCRESDDVDVRLMWIMMDCTDDDATREGQPWSQETIFDFFYHRSYMERQSLELHGTMMEIVSEHERLDSPQCFEAIFDAIGVTPCMSRLVQNGSIDCIHWKSTISGHPLDTVHLSFGRESVCQYFLQQGATRLCGLEGYQHPCWKHTTIQHFLNRLLTECETSENGEYTDQTRRSLRALEMLISAGFGPLMMANESVNRLLQSVMWKFPDILFAMDNNGCVPEELLLDDLIYVASYSLETLRDVVIPALIEVDPQHPVWYKILCTYIAVGKLEHVRLLFSKINNQHIAIDPQQVLETLARIANHPNMAVRRMLNFTSFHPRYLDRDKTITHLSGVNDHVMIYMHQNGLLDNHLFRNLLIISR